MPIEASKTPKQTVVEEGTEFKGTIKSSCAVVINGTIDGDVDAPEVTITRSGAIAGAVKATKLRSQGTLSGKVEATDVFLSGVVRSNTAIKAKRLEAKLGSDSAQIEVTFGECALEVGDTVAEPAVVAAPARADAAPVADGEIWGAPAEASASPSPPATAAASAAPGNGTRSPWKPSRSIEVGGQDAAKTLR
jgi:cytoskeletal protein CcmA (bactofilin family)